MTARTAIFSALAGALIAVTWVAIVAGDWNPAHWPSGIRVVAALLSLCVALGCATVPAIDQQRVP